MDSFPDCRCQRHIAMQLTYVIYWNHVHRHGSGQVTAYMPNTHTHVSRNGVRHTGRTICDVMCDPGYRGRAYAISRMNTSYVTNATTAFTATTSSTTSRTPWIRTTLLGKYPRAEIRWCTKHARQYNDNGSALTFKSRSRPSSGRYSRDVSITAKYDASANGNGSVGGSSNNNINSSNVSNNNNPPYPSSMQPASSIQSEPLKPPKIQGWSFEKRKAFLEALDAFVETEIELDAQEGLLNPPGGFVIRNGVGMPYAVGIDAKPGGINKTLGNMRTRVVKYFDGLLPRYFLFGFVYLMTATFYFMYLEQWSFVDALYFAVQAGFTIGWGDLVPEHEESQLFVSFFLLTGNLFFGGGLALFARTILQRQSERRDTWSMNDLRASNNSSSSGSDSEAGSSDESGTLSNPRLPTKLPTLGEDIRRLYNAVRRLNMVGIISAMIESIYLQEPDFHATGEGGSTDTLDRRLEARRAFVRLSRDFQASLIYKLLRNIFNLFLWLVFGTLVGLWGEKYSFYDALQFAVSCLTTYGLTPPREDTASRLFAVFYVVGGVLVYFQVAGSVADAFLELYEIDQTKKLLKNRKIQGMYVLSDTETESSGYESDAEAMSSGGWKEEKQAEFADASRAELSIVGESVDHHHHGHRNEKGIMIESLSLDDGGNMSDGRLRDELDTQVEEIIQELGVSATPNSEAEAEYAKKMKKKLRKVLEKLEEDGKMDDIIQELQDITKFNIQNLMELSDSEMERWEMQQRLLMQNSLRVSEPGSESESDGEGQDGYASGSESRKALSRSQSSGTYAQKHRKYEESWSSYLEAQLLQSGALTRSQLDKLRISFIKNE